MLIFTKTFLSELEPLRGAIWSNITHYTSLFVTIKRDSIYSPQSVKNECASECVNLWVIPRMSPHHILQYNAICLSPGSLLHVPECAYQMHALIDPKDWSWDHPIVYYVIMSNSKFVGKWHGGAQYTEALCRANVIPFPQGLPPLVLGVFLSFLLYFL